ncbi:Sentrin-specific protease 7 [Frankliniella fusca]|uniref:Sentrin-specific protease 7 n=1 Tax=Frankliniella fusca TaxID=407009 RepID=A0AAE1HRM7_9NEOP|nr:Sentrin-specific protease 7 [Frankliniella fusca]
MRLRSDHCGRRRLRFRSSACPEYPITISVSVPMKLLYFLSFDDTCTPKYPWEEKRSFPLVSPSPLFSCKGITLTHRDFDCLKPGKWLNDVVIDSFLRVISDPGNLKEPEACMNILSSVSIENISMGADFVLKAVGSSDKFFNDIWLVPSRVYRILRPMLADSHMHCFGTAIDWSQWSITLRSPPK